MNVNQGIAAFKADRIIQATLLLSLVPLVLMYWWGAYNTVPEHYYQPILAKLFAVVNIVPFILAGLALSLTPWNPSNLAMDRLVKMSIEAEVFYESVFILFYLIQWLFVGVLISKSWSNYKRR
jgi:hypothetical protein